MERDFIQRCIRELRGAHNVIAIAVVGHEECAGHSVSNDQHKDDILQSARLLSELNKGISVFGFFAHQVDGDGCQLDYLGCKMFEEAQVA